MQVRQKEIAAIEFHRPRETRWSERATHCLVALIERYSWGDSSWT
jgi:hypothetical protein